MNLFNHPKYLSDELNASSKEEIFYAFKKGLRHLYGKDLPFRSIVVLLAHSALETGRWCAGLHRWNFGNIRAYPNKLKEGEYFTMFRCGEILKGKEVFFEPPEPESCFRAFMSLEDGMEHHLKFLKRKRYAKAWQEVLKGDPAGYSHELRAGGYYTANEKLYTKTLVRLFNEYIKQEKELTSWTPPRPALAQPLKSDDIPIPYSPVPPAPEPNEPNKPLKVSPAVAIGLLLGGALAWIASVLKDVGERLGFSITLEKDGIPIGSIKTLWMSKDYHIFHADLIRFDTFRLNEVFQRSSVHVATQKAPLSVKIKSDFAVSSAKGADVFDGLWFTELNCGIYQSDDFVIAGIYGPLFVKGGEIRLER